MRLEDARAVVVLFVMPGCPACQEFKPRFNARVGALSGYLRQASVEVVELDAMAPANAAYAARYGVTATPTVLVVRRPVGWFKIEGGVGNEEIDRALAAAMR